MANFNEGDRVVYVSGRHGNASNNPLTPGKHACEGTTSRCQRGESIQVNWDNGEYNSYSTSDLAPAAKGGRMDPNLAFRIKKRRG